MIGYLGALAKDRDCISAVLIYRFAGRLIYGFAIFHATLTPIKPEVPPELTSHIDCNVH